MSDLVRMKKLAMVKNGNVETVFPTDKEIEDFPDIASLLVDVTGLDVECNFKFDGAQFISPMIEDDSGVEPTFFQKIINWFRR